MPMAEVSIIIIPFLVTESACTSSFLTPVTGFLPKKEMKIIAPAASGRIINRIICLTASFLFRICFTWLIYNNQVTSHKSYKSLCLSNIFRIIHIGFKNCSKVHRIFFAKPIHVSYIRILYK